MGRNLTDLQAVERMEDWVAKGDGRRVVQFELKDSWGRETTAFRLEDGEGRIKKYVIQNYNEKEGVGWRFVNEGKYEKFKDGYDVDYRMPEYFPLITGPGGGGGPYPSKTEVREIIQNYVDIPGRSSPMFVGTRQGDVITKPVDPAALREFFEGQGRSAQKPVEQEVKSTQATSEPPKAENVAAAKSVSSSDTKSDSKAALPAAAIAKPVQMTPVTDAVSGTQRIDAAEVKSPYINDQYIASEKFYSDVAARGNRFFKPGNDENGMILEVDKNGKVVRGIERDSNDPTMATVKQGADLIESLERERMSVQAAERSAARIFGDVDQVQRKAPQLAVTSPNLTM